MSDLLYPVSLITRQQVTPLVSVVGDQFEAGNTSTRRLWTTRYQKRRFEIDHAPLTETEFRALRSFYSQRDGDYDSFWYRDNVLRGGNASVRFAGPLAATKARNTVDVSVALEEIAAVQALTELDEVTAAAGATPIAWYDANRQRYYDHLGTTYYEALLHDYAGASCDLTLQAGSNPLSNKLSQRQYWRADGAAWLKMAGNVSSSVISGTQPALTWFLITRAKPVNSTYAHAVVGSSASGGAFGLGLDGSNNRWGIISGAAIVTDGSSQVNSSDAWQSMAAGVSASSNSVRIWRNGTLVQDLTVSRTHAAGPISFFANAAGSFVANTEADSIHDVQHAILFPAKLTTTTVKALHNLLAYQTGMATV